jgi:hypothetical protein
MSNKIVNNNKVFDICKENILGYTINTMDNSYDDTLDYVEVTVKFYIKHETSNENVAIIKSYTDSLMCDTIVEKMDFLDEICPHETASQLRNEDKFGGVTV